MFKFQQLIHFKLVIYHNSKRIQLYKFLRTIHRSCGSDPIPRRKVIRFKTWWLSGSSSKKNTLNAVNEPNFFSVFLCNKNSTCQTFLRISSFLRKPDRCPACLIRFLVFQWESDRSRTTCESSLKVARKSVRFFYVFTIIVMTIF